jgi:hypothetical protein
MSMTMTAGGSAATSDLYGDFESGVYEIEVSGMKMAQSTLYKDKEGNAKEQVEFTVTFPDVEDPQSGDPLQRKVWLGAVLLEPNPDAKTPRGKQGSQLWRFVLAASGTRCQDGVRYDLEELCLRKRLRAYCRLNENGYPRIDNDSFEPVKARKSPTPAAPAAPAVAAPARPTPPKPAAPRPAGLTDDQMEQVRTTWAAAGYGGAASWQRGSSENYDGRGLAQIRADEWDGLVEALGIPPFWRHWRGWPPRRRE